MEKFEKFNKRKEEEKTTDAKPSETINRSHSARQRQLLSLGTTEEQFLQGLKRSKSSENLGSSRKTGEFGLDRPSSSGKEGERAKTSEEHWQELEKIETSLFKVSKELYLAAGIITKYEKQPPQILGETLEMYKKSQ
jgi:hypothetical protein